MNQLSCFFSKFSRCDGHFEEKFRPCFYWNTIVLFPKVERWAVAFTRALQIISFPSKRWNDEKRDTKSWTICNGSGPFPCEQIQKRKIKTFAPSACMDVKVRLQSLAPSAGIAEIVQTLSTPWALVMTLKWWGLTGYQTHSAWLFWLNVASLHHNIYSIKSPLGFQNLNFCKLSGSYLLL